MGINPIQAVAAFARYKNLKAVDITAEIVTEMAQLLGLSPDNHAVDAFVASARGEDPMESVMNFGLKKLQDGTIFKAFRPVPMWVRCPHCHNPFIAGGDEPPSQE